MQTVERDGWIWPAEDRECFGAVKGTITDLSRALGFSGRDVAVQAGGNCGIWPKELSRHFGTVYTFEPDPLNFHCLARNCPEPNVIKLQACLGLPEPPVALLTDRHNIGAHQVHGTGAYPVIALDSLQLPKCDLIQLDIEGYELFALKGAEQTLRRFRPVVMIEDKGLSERYGVKQGDAVEYLIHLGYSVRDRINRDIILC